MMDVLGLGLWLAVAIAGFLALAAVTVAVFYAAVYGLIKVIQHGL
jgi:hypothetical protein